MNTIMVKSPEGSSVGSAQMWRYEGRQTLEYYLKRRDCNAALAEALGVEAQAVVPTVMAHVLTGVSVSTVPRNPTICQSSPKPRCEPLARALVSLGRKCLRDLEEPETSWVCFPLS